jgi:hypothetical protein
MPLCIAKTYAQVQPWHLLVTIGIFYPAFGSEYQPHFIPIFTKRLATYLPCSTLLFEWFYVRRGLASGILFAGTGVGGAIFPPLVSGMLSRFGYKATMVSLGFGFLILGGISLIPIKRRLPYTRGGGRRHGAAGRFSGQGKILSSKPMLVGGSIVLLVGLGNFIPSLWIPSTSSRLARYLS